MAIKRMINTRNPDELREFQTRLTTVGKIRLGQFLNEGKGRPVKLPTFRLTSPDRALIEAVAELYGGTAQEWKPQGGGDRQWEVVTDATSLPVFVVNGQKIDPTYEAWGAGRTCVRRCDGEWEVIQQRPCVCNGPKERRPALRDLCKVTTRMSLMLADVPGLGSWLLESHGENFAFEVGDLPARLVAVATVPVPAVLYLQQETRRPYDPEKGKHVTQEFYVPRLAINSLTARALGTDPLTMTEALIAGGAPAALGSGPVSAAIEAAPAGARAIEAAPPASPATPAPAGPPALSDEERRARILRSIEQATTLDELEEIKAKLKARGVTDQVVKDAWASRRAGLLASAELDELVRTDGGKELLERAIDTLPPEKVEELRQLVALEPTRKPCLNPFCADTPEPCGFTPNEHMEFHGVATLYEAELAREDGPMVQTVDAEIVDEPARDPIAQEVDRRAVTVDALARHPETVAAREQEATVNVDVAYGLIAAEVGKLGWSTPKLNAQLKLHAGVDRIDQVDAAAMMAFLERVRSGEFGTAAA